VSAGCGRRGCTAICDDEESVGGRVERDRPADTVAAAEAAIGGAAAGVEVDGEGACVGGEHKQAAVWDGRKANR